LNFLESRYPQGIGIFLKLLYFLILLSEMTLSQNKMLWKKALNEIMKICQATQ